MSILNPEKGPAWGGPLSSTSGKAAAEGVQLVCLWSDCPAILWSECGTVEPETVTGPIYKAVALPP